MLFRSDALGGDLEIVARRLEAVYALVDDYNAYAGINPDGVGKVQFIIHTTDIAKD